MSSRGWQPGYTHGRDFGKWSKVDSGLQKYERRERLVYGAPKGEDADLYRANYDRIFSQKPKAEKWDLPDPPVPSSDMVKP